MVDGLGIAECHWRPFLGTWEPVSHSYMILYLCSYFVAHKAHFISLVTIRHSLRAPFDLQVGIETRLAMMTEILQSIIVHKTCVERLLDFLACSNYGFRERVHCSPYLFSTIMCPDLIIE